MRVTPTIYYKTIHFKLEELISKPIFDKYGERAWQFFDSRALYTIDCLREFFGTLCINTWLWGGSSQYRGYRERTCDIGAENSQHRRGAAFDLISKNYMPQEMKLGILEHNRLFPYISAIEEIDTHTHIDCRNCPGQTIMIFK